MKQITFPGGAIEVSETITAAELMVMHADLSADAVLKQRVFDNRGDVSIAEAVTLGNAAQLAINKAEAVETAAREIDPLYVRRTLQQRAAARRELQCGCGHSQGHHTHAIPYSCTIENCGCERFHTLEA